MINVLINGCNGNMGKVLGRYIKEITSDMTVKYLVDRNSEISFQLLDSKIKSIL